jgi:hypothetical protein
MTNEMGALLQEGDNFLRLRIEECGIPGSRRRPRRAPAIAAPIEQQQLKVVS